VGREEQEEEQEEEEEQEQERALPAVTAIGELAASAAIAL